MGKPRIQKTNHDSTVLAEKQRYGHDKSVWQLLYWNKLYVRHTCRSGQNLWKISHFTWMTLSKPSKMNDAEPSNQFEVSNGVPNDEVKCSDQLSHLQIFKESCFNIEEFTSLLTYQKSQKLKKWWVPLQNCWRCHSSLPFPSIMHMYSKFSHWCKPSEQWRETCWTLSYSEAFYSYNFKDFLVQIFISS